MNERRSFPAARPGHFYLCEGGVETEIMYRHGFDFPHFAVFELLKDPSAVDALEGMYRTYLDVVAAHGLSALIGGLDYRASPDWGRLLGYSADGLADVNHRCIGFLRDVASDYSGDIDEILIQGLVGPRGDAYGRDLTLTADEAQDYHAVQLETLKSARVDLATAITFNGVPESIGFARAAAELDVPACISLSLDGSSCLSTGPALGEAVTAIDDATDASVAFFMINCVHPLEYEPALDGAGWMRRLRGVRPNASAMDKLKLCEIGHLEEGDPVELGRQVGDLSRRHPHMDVFGGCCGTWDGHLDRIAADLKATMPLPTSR